MAVIVDNFVDNGDFFSKIALFLLQNKKKYGIWKDPLQDKEE